MCKTSLGINPESFLSKDHWCAFHVSLTPIWFHTPRTFISYLLQNNNAAYEYSPRCCGRAKRDEYGNVGGEYDRNSDFIEVHWQPVSRLSWARWAVCRNVHANIDLQLGETDALAQGPQYGGISKKRCTHKQPWNKYTVNKQKHTCAVCTNILGKHPPPRSQCQLTSD